MAAFAGLSQALGQAGSDLGVAGLNTQVARRNNAMQDLAMIQARLQLQELQQRINEGKNPKVIGESTSPFGGFQIALQNPDGTISYKNVGQVSTPQDFTNSIGAAMGTLPQNVQARIKPTIDSYLAVKDYKSALGVIAKEQANAAKPPTAPKVNFVEGVPYSITQTDPATGIENTWTKDNIGTAPSGIQSLWTQAQAAHKTASQEKINESRAKEQAKYTSDDVTSFAQQLAADGNTAAVPSAIRGQVYTYMRKNGIPVPPSLVRMRAADAAAKPYLAAMTALDKGVQGAAQDSGAGDVALMMSFIDATRPSVFRFSPSEITLIKNATSASGIFKNYETKALTGKLFNTDQRKQMLETMKAAADQARIQGVQVYKRYGVPVPPELQSTDSPGDKNIF